LGLIDTGHSGLYARFIERITFPIYSLNGGIVGFGGRTITGHQAKYVNSPQTKIFNKSRLLYGYHLAKQSIYKKKRIIVCEGYLDVVMLHQAGFDEAVATLGTSLTNEHIPIIKRGEPYVVLSYDGDGAGQKAAFKASVMLSQQKCNGGVVVFGEGLDPADMVKDGKINELNTLFDTPRSFVEFAIDFIASKYDLNIPENIEKAYEEVNNYLQTLSKIIRAKYEDYAKQKLKITNVNLASTNVFIKENRFNSKANLGKKDDLAELSIIKTLLLEPSYLDFVLEMVDSSIFETHEFEFKELLENEDMTNSKALKDIYFKDEIEILNHDELKSQIKVLLVKAFIQQKAKISSSDMDFKTKTYNIRKCDSAIRSLKKGVLVPFVKLI
jgi:DNA primase